jgi:hypothetical protein
MCTLITSKGTDIDENIANQNHANRTRTPKPGYLSLSIINAAEQRVGIWQKAKILVVEMSSVGETNINQIYQKVPTWGQDKHFSVPVKNNWYTILLSKQLFIGFNASLLRVGLQKCSQMTHPRDNIDVQISYGGGG